MSNVLYCLPCILAKDRLPRLNVCTPITYHVTIFSQSDPHITRGIHHVHVHVTIFSQSDPYITRGIHHIHVHVWQ